MKISLTSEIGKLSISFVGCKQLINWIFQQKVIIFDS